MEQKRNNYQLFNYFTAIVFISIFVLTLILIVWPTPTPKIIGNLANALGADFNANEHAWYFWDTNKQVFSIFNTQTKKISLLPIKIPKSFSAINHISWANNHHFAIIQNDSEKMVLGFKTGITIILPQTGQNFTWSLDNTKLAYQIKKSTYLSEIHVLDLNTGADTIITTLDLSSSYFTNGKINLTWTPNNNLFYSDLVLDASSPNWEILTTTSTYSLTDLELVNFSPDQNKLLFTRSFTAESGDQVVYYGIKTLTTEQETITKLPDSFLCDWESSDTLLCLRTNRDQTKVAIIRYEIETAKQILLREVKMFATQLPNNPQFIQFDIALRRLYVVTGGGTVYSIDY